MVPKRSHDLLVVLSTVLYEDCSIGACLPTSPNLRWSNVIDASITIRHQPGQEHRMTIQPAAVPNWEDGLPSNTPASGPAAGKEPCWSTRQRRAAGTCRLPGTDPGQLMPARLEASSRS